MLNPVNLQSTPIATPCSPPQVVSATVADTERVDQATKSIWQRTVDYLGIGAEASNIGIVFVVLSQLIPPLLALGKAFFSTISFITDPIIYCFRALIRVVRIVGREFFGVKFEEEHYGKHKYQLLGDLASLALFGLAIPLFFGAIITSPIGLTLAWVLALTGIGIVGFFDYFHPAKLSEDALKNTTNPTPDLIKDCTSKKNSARLYAALLIGLSLLLICTSAAVFAPPVLIPILLIVSKIASAYLGCIAVGRFANWAWTHYTKPAVPVESTSPIIRV